MVNGLIAQLMNRVRNTGLPLLPALITSPKSILTMMGYIMKNRQTAIGNGDHRRAVDEYGHAVQGAGHPRCNFAQQNSAHDAQEHPDGKVAFENTGHFTFVGIGSICAHRSIFSIFCLLLQRFRQGFDKFTDFVPNPAVVDHGSPLRWILLWPVPADRRSLRERSLAFPGNIGQVSWAWPQTVITKSHGSSR